MAKIIGGLCGMSGLGCMVLGRLVQKNHYRGRVSPKVEYIYAPPPSREEMISQMKTRKQILDVVVVGGGATGSGVALDAATRGLSCALLEANDFACGTSSRSTKLIHGGIRYLQAAMMKLDVGMFKLVCEALEERSHLMRAAPYMSHPIPILMPVYRLWEVPMFWVGVKMYDWLGKIVCLFKPGLPNCFWISKSNSSFFFPLLNPKRLKGSIVYYDGQMNDARLNVQLALTASVDGYIPGMKGALVANHCRVLDVKRAEGGDQHFNSVGGYDVKVEDSLTKDRFTVKAKTVINCTGPLSDEFRQKVDPNSRKLVAASAGVHITLPDYFSSAPFGMIIPETTDKRVLYYLPWEGNTIAGTTDRPVTPTDSPQATKEEVDFVIKESCRYLSVNEEDLRRDINSTWCGLRPLVTNPQVEESKALSRTHEVLVEDSGVISVMGGKWTTYRKMAEDTLNKVVALYGDRIQFSTVSKVCRTKFLLLSNAIDPSKKFKTADVLSGSGRLPLFLHHTYGISMTQARHLVSNYGFRALDICSMGVDDCSMLQPIDTNHPFIKAEVIYAVRNEMARTPSDVLARRMRIAFVDVQLASRTLHSVVHTMAKELNWSATKCKQMEDEGNAYLQTMNSGMS